MARIFFFLLGFGLNLFAMGYSIIDYLVFVFTRAECIFGIIGFLIVTIAIFYKGGSKNVIYMIFYLIGIKINYMIFLNGKKQIN